jgi:hypothetical protein
MGAGTKLARSVCMQKGPGSAPGSKYQEVIQSAISKGQGKSSTDSVPAYTSPEGIK